ncbi:hypothetical protein C7N43_13355 [Sphingobacteriales bacterium UPWRP_1]|nr:hypothetical protein B6N25_03490 [Sphingobacteriales bacterium TSM_CSS]PSJ76516.1 hypothetical protein C7N43_13355 [Sphingobacteriales bacterium UPWRP_1]
MMHKFYALLICLFVFIAVQPAQAQSQAKTVKKLPEFSFYDLDGKVFTSKQLKYDKYLMVVYFDPDCEHCNAQAEQIKNNIAKFKGVTMVWLSIGDPGMMKDFKNKYFANSKQVIFLHDPTMNIFKAFPDAIETPTLYIYNKNKVQIAKLGECKAADIYKNFK